MVDLGNFPLCVVALVERIKPLAGPSWRMIRITSFLTCTPSSKNQPFRNRSGTSCAILLIMGWRTTEKKRQAKGSP